ncbi:BZIP domain-containing protein [Fusarium sp. LHS14.1]|nr:BZIP domain-containing protein [Fusarium sp. LHS14.1]
MASTRSSTNKHEPTSPDLDKNQKRKLRNRLSQRAFRRRQAEYLRDLRNRAEASQKPDNERIAELEEENGRLRAHITELQSRLEGVQVTLQMIASSSSKILGRSKSSLPHQPRIEERDSEQEENESSTDGAVTADKVQSDANPWPPFSSAALESIQIPDLSFSTDVDSTIEIPTSDAMQTRHNLVQDVIDCVGPIDPNLSKSPLQLQRIPDIWNFNCQMGSQSYVDAVESCASSKPTSGLRWIDFNSPILGHIQILRRPLLTKVKPTIRDDRSFQTLYQYVSTMLAMLDSVARPGVMNRYAKTRFFHAIERKSCPVSSGEGIDNMASLPAPDIKTLFSSPECSYLNMNCGAFYYKIGPVFFSKYPKLWGPSDEIVASGVPLKPGTQTTLTSPNSVDVMTVATYHSFVIFFSFGAAIALSRPEYV